MDIRSAADFTNQNALVNQYATQMGNFQPTAVGAQPQGAQMRLRDVLLSNGTSSPYVGAAVGAANQGAAAALSRGSPLAAKNAGRTMGGMQQTLQDRALTSMFPVVSGLALGGAQQELARYTGARGLQQDADKLRLQGIAGAGKLANQGVGVINQATGTAGARMSNQVATPWEALQAELAKARGLQQLAQTQYNNTYAFTPGATIGVNAPGQSVGQFNAQNALAAGNQNIANITQQSSLYTPTLRTSYGY